MNADRTTKLHLLREPPRLAWCGGYTPAARLVTNRREVTCLPCQRAIEAARREMQYDKAGAATPATSQQS